MNRVSHELELAMWREACRHLDIQESLERIFPILTHWFAVSGCVIRRLSKDRPLLETVAVAGKLPPISKGASALDSQTLSRLTELGKERRVQPSTFDAQSPLLGRPVERNASANALIGLLHDEAGPVGLLMMFATTTFTAADARLCDSLIEPLSIALENDRRLHELARLREAAEAENRALLTRLQRDAIVESVVGERGGLRQVMERVEQVAPTDAPVLILGETGSGKEIIARAIHDRSRRKNGPMVRVNCGAIPSELVDSELFGHERGSFTGAVSTRQGWFERADGGTLLLDEVGELPLAAQVRLLRVLQEGTLERVGSNRTLRVDVRIVAATHRDLVVMVSEGRFREDLWYRLNIFPLRLPSLRERREDIPALAAHFAAKAGERLGGAPLSPSTKDVDLLVSYAWPGNVRELAAVIERAAILGHGKRLDVAAALGAANPATLSPSQPPPAESAPTLSTPKEDTALTLDAMARIHIERALARTKGRVEGPHGAAILLNINPHTLRARMRKLGISWASYRAAKLSD